MMQMIDTTYRLFAPEVAEVTATKLQSGDEDWKYEVVHCPKGTGFSFINIFDEDGEFVGRVR